MSQRFERGTLQRARDDTVRKVYEDAVLTFGNHKPFDPCKVVASRRNLPAGEPWGFFIGGMDSPQTVDDENARMVSDALGWSFSPSVLAQAYLIASRKDAAGGRT